MICDLCSSYVEQLKHFLAAGKEKKVCVQCYTQYFSDPDKRAAVEAVPEA